MIERLIENWLINTGERGYEVAFAQLLAAEGYRIIQGPVHHPFEHGKDILTLASNNSLHAYQLKGPDLTNLESFERIQGQLLALAGTAVTHPAVSPPRRPDRVFLVTTAVLTPPVRDRIEKFNAASLPDGWPMIEPIEQQQLLSRFLSAHGKFLPQSLPEVRPLIELYYSDSDSLFPTRSFAEYLTSLLPFPPKSPSLPECRSAVASLALLTAYASSRWTDSDNYLCVAAAWLTACTTLMNFAAVRGLEEDVWMPSYRLSLEAARTALASLAREASEAEDVLVPDLVEGLIYPSRALLVCGFLGAYLISERTLGPFDPSLEDHVRNVLTRERRFIKLAGECDVPRLIVAAMALEQLGGIREAEALVMSLAVTLSRTNQRHSTAALPDPYHETEQVLLQQMGVDSGLEGEEFDGRSYMLHIAVEWLSRRLWRQHLASFWPEITRVQFVEFQPSSPDRYLSINDDDGELRMWFPGQPQSWAALLESSSRLDKAKLPQLLWLRREMMPYLPLLFPYRMTADFSRAVDAIAHDPTY